MIRTATLLLTTLCLAGVSYQACAQTYFYLEQILVDPPAPTDQDDVELELAGNLSSTTSFIQNASATVNGFNVLVVINAANTGGIGIPMMVPHTETVDLGQLPPGTYTITVGGTATNDGAMPGEHVFTVTGGTPSPCDSLIINSVTWGPFSDSTLVVHVHNNSSTLFNYPGFVLLNDEGETLGLEAVDFFGIPAENWHVLAVPAGADLPEGSFDATLQLWVDFYGQQVCTFNMDLSLCPPEACSMLFPTVMNLGSAITTGTFSYEIREDDVTLASGSLSLSGEQSTDTDTLCLPPGEYTMVLTADQPPTGGQPYFGVTAPGYAQGPLEPVDFVTGGSEVDFDLYEPCMDITTGIRPETRGSDLVISVAQGQVQIARNDGRALGELRLFDAQGRALAGVHTAGPTHVFRTVGLATGIYVLRAVDEEGHVLSARWVVQ